MGNHHVDSSFMSLLFHLFLILVSVCNGAEIIPPIVPYNEAPNTIPDTSDRLKMQVGFLQDLTSNYATLGLKQLRAMKIAVAEINENEDLLPGIDLEIVVGDSQSDFQIAIKESLEIFNTFPDIMALFGCSLSVPTIHVQYIVASLDKIQISSSATSSFLSDQKSAPNFIRTNGGGFAHVLVHVINQFGWKTVATIHQRNQFQVKENLDFTQACEKENIDVVSQALSDSGKWSNFTKELLQIKHSGIRIIAMFSYCESASKVFATAEKLGMVDGYLWLGLDSWSLLTTSCGASSEFGTIAVHPKHNENSQYYNDLVDKWSYYYNETSEIDWTAVGIYDAVYAFAHGMTNLNPKDFTNHTRIFDAIVNVTLPRRGLPDLKFTKIGDAESDYNIVSDIGNTLRSVGSFDSKHQIQLNESLINWGAASSGPPVSDRVCGENEYIVGATCTMCQNDTCSGGGDVFECQPCTRLETISDGFLIVIVLLVAILALFSIAIIVGILYYRSNPDFRATGIQTYIIMIFGCWLAFAHVALLLIPVNNSVCILQSWLSRMAFVFTFGMLVVKNFRVVKLFINSRSLQRNTFTLTRTMLIFFGLFILFFTVLMLQTFLVNDFVAEYKTSFDGVTSSTYRICAYGAYDWTLLAVQAALGLFGIMLSFELKGLAHSFRETWYTTISLYCWFFSTIVFVVTRLLTFGSNFAFYYILETMYYLVTWSVVLCLVFATKLYSVKFKSSQNPSAVIMEHRSNLTINSALDLHHRTILKEMRQLREENKKLKESLPTSAVPLPCITEKVELENDFCSNKYSQSVQDLDEDSST